MFKEYKEQVFFVVIRLFVWIYLLGLAPDIANQLNIALNFSTGHGLKLGIYDEQMMKINYIDYFDHPPLFSIIIGVFNFLIKDIVISLFVWVLFLTVIESWIIKRVLLLINVTSNKSFYFLIFSFYIGHIDRGTLSDYTALIFALVYLLFLWKMITNKTDGANFIIFLLMAISIPFMKYSLLPLTVIPILVFFFYKFVNRSSYSSADSPPKILLVSSLLSFGAAYFMVNLQKSVLPTESHFAIDIYNLLKIDYFWLHWGLDIDRIYKHISWNMLEHLNLDVNFWNIGQIITIPVFFYFVYRYSVTYKPVRAELRNLLFIGLIQIGFLVFLTVTNIPQSPVKYGVDDKVWVYIEESRYYNYLTLLCFILFTIAVVDKIKHSKWILLLLVLFGYFNKCSLDIYKSNLYTLYNYNQKLKFMALDEIVKIPNEKLTKQQRHHIFIVTGIEKR